MNSAIRVVIGAFGGALLAYFGCSLFLAATASSDGSDAQSAFMSKLDVDSERWQRYGPKILTVTVMGGLLGGIGAVILGANTVESTRKVRRHVASHGPSVPLNAEQFQRVLASCGWANLRNKSPDYVKGLIVGRFADSDPAIAQQVDRFDEFDMEALVDKIQRHRDRVHAKANQ